MNRVAIMAMLLVLATCSPLILQNPLLLAGGPALSQFSVNQQSLAAALSGPVRVYLVSSPLSTTQNHKRVLPLSSSYPFYSQYLSYQPNTLLTLLQNNPSVQLTHHSISLPDLTQVTPHSGEQTLVMFQQSTHPDTMRMLEEEMQVETKPVPIGITGIVLSGYLVSLFCLVILLIGGCCLFSLQTPAQFPKTNYVVGRES